MQSKSIWFIIPLAVAIVALAIGIVALLNGPPGPPGLSYSPMDIALLRWWEANEAGNTFDVGDMPRGICFDGANIWVTNLGSDTVSKT